MAIHSPIADPDQDPASNLESRQSASGGVISNLEWCLLCLLGVVAAVGHVMLFCYAGGLWRDEANTVNLATQATWGDIWNKLAFDSSGLVWLALVRAWTAIGLGDDNGLRGLGMLVGLGMLGALVWTARTLGSRVPILAVCVFGFAPATIVFGDSMRAYGWATLMILLAATLMFRMAVNPTTRRIILAGLAAVMSVHCAFPNAHLVLAICVAAAAVGIQRGDRKAFIASMGTALFSILSVLVYYPTSVRVADWIVIKRQSVTWSMIYDVFGTTLGTPVTGASAVWIGLLALGLIGALGRLWSSRRDTSDSFTQTRSQLLFVSIAMVLSIAGQVVYFKMLSYEPRAWHCLPAFGLLIALTDAGVSGSIKLVRFSRPARLGATALYATLMAWTALSAVNMRQTNMDLVAQRIAAQAGPEDIVIVRPFYYGISFERYYKGPAPWTTLPKLEDHSVHRWDLIKRKMEQVNPDLSAVLGAVTAVRTGHRVWIVGDSTLRNGKHVRLKELEPAPKSRFGWNEDVYEGLWASNLDYALDMIARSERIAVEVDGPVNPYENVELWVAEARPVQVRPGPLPAPPPVSQTQPARNGGADQF